MCFRVHVVLAIVLFPVSDSAVIASGIQRLSRKEGFSKNDRTMDVCVPLVNKGVYCTVEVNIGTPSEDGERQKFSVVADTGSDDLVIPSCVCVTHGSCSSDTVCFKGTGKSSTFNLSSRRDNPDEPIMVEITYGSGPISCALATDVVRVGDLSTTMENGVCLITTNNLDLGGVAFEGILGLGVPQSQQLGSGYMDAALSELPPGRKAKGDDDTSGGIAENKRMAPQNQASDVPTFASAAKVKHFTMCFNEGRDGALRAGTYRNGSSLRAVGTYHWAVNFTGLSIGDSSNKTIIPQICGSEQTDAGSSTPCAVIPDSGTTLIMAPMAHVTAMFSTLCERWPRCKIAYDESQEAAKAASDAYKKVRGSDPYNLTEKLSTTLYDTFQALIDDCQTWMGNDTGLKEMPSIFLNFADSTGKSSEIELTAWSYVMETLGTENDNTKNKKTGIDRNEFNVNSSKTQPLVELIHQALSLHTPHFLRSEPSDRSGSNITVDAQILADALRAVDLRERYRNSSNVKKVRCSPAFDTMDYVTTTNGPVWIIGTPVFYEYNVGFNLTAPPSVSFVSQKITPCNECGQEDASLAADATTTMSQVGRILPRRVVPPFRYPSVDTSREL